MCPFKICTKVYKDELILKYSAMVYPIMGWFEITLYKYKKTIKSSNIVENTWL